MASFPSWRSSKRGGASSKRGGRSGARKPASRTRKPAKKPVKKATSAPREFEQRHLDLIGLACLAGSLYLGFVLYGGWEGGKVGEGLEVALTWLAGAGSYILPLLLAGVGLALVMRPFVRYPGAVNAGALLLAAGMLLALAAGTFGLGPDQPARGDRYFDQDFFTEHGGAVGESLYWAAATLFQRIGAHIIALLLVISGILLLTGRPIAGLLRSGAEAGRRARHATGDFARTARDARAERTERITDYGPYPPDDDMDATLFEEPGETMELDADELEPVDPIETEVLGDGPGEHQPTEQELRDALEVEGDPDALPVIAPDDDEAQIEILRTPMGAKRTVGGIT